MSNQPNEAAENPLAFTALRQAAQGWREWDRTENPRDAEGRILDGAAWGILTAIRDGKVPLPDDCPQITSLRSALAAAEKERDALKKDAADHCDALTIAHGMGYCSRNNEVRKLAADLAAALAKLAEAEKERDRLREHHSFYQSIQSSQQSHQSLCARVANAAIKSRVVYNFGACGGGEPTFGAIVAKIEEAIVRCDAIASERAALVAQLAEARGLLGEANDCVGHIRRCDCDECAISARIDAFLAPPSDRGAEDKS